MATPASGGTTKNKARAATSIPTVRSTMVSGSGIRSREPVPISIRMVICMLVSGRMIGGSVRAKWCTLTRHSIVVAGIRVSRMAGGGLCSLMGISTMVHGRMAKCTALEPTPQME